MGIWKYPSEISSVPSVRVAGSHNHMNGLYKPRTNGGVPQWIVINSVYERDDGACIYRVAGPTPTWMICDMAGDMRYQIDLNADTPPQNGWRQNGRFSCDVTVTPETEAPPVREPMPQSGT